MTQFFLAEFDIARNVAKLTGQPPFLRFPTNAQHFESAGFRGFRDAVLTMYHHHSSDDIVDGNGWTPKRQHAAATQSAPAGGVQRAQLAVHFHQLIHRLQAESNMTRGSDRHGHIDTAPVGNVGFGDQLITRRVPRADLHPPKVLVRSAMR